MSVADIRELLRLGVIRASKSLSSGLYRYKDGTSQGLEADLAILWRVMKT